MNKLIRAGSACLMFALPTSAMAGSETARKKTDDVKTVASVKDTIAELSVPPLDHLEYPRSRPSWCNKTTDFASRDHRVVVLAGPCDSADQCSEELQWMQRGAVVTYANELVDSPSKIDFTAFSDEDIDERLVSRRYEGPVTVGGETKYEKVVQLTFTPKIRSEIRRASLGIEVRRRLGFLAFAGVVGTALLICSSGLLGWASRRISRLERLPSLD